MKLKFDADTETKPGRRVVVLEASYDTQVALRGWASAAGFNLGWSHSGWPQRSDDFRFHVTVIATANAVKLPPTWRAVDALTLVPAGFEVLGDNTPTLRLDLHPNLQAMREFFVAEFGAEPTYPDFKPHVSLSYRWDGAPALDALTSPTFPLVFDCLSVSELEEPVAAPVMAGDAAPVLLSVTDKASVSGTRRTRDGYLVADARVARTGIQEYLGFEVGKPDMPTVRVYRPESEVFSRDAMGTYAFRPVTMGHPADGVSAENWRKEAIGTTGAEVARDGDFVRVPLVLMDANAIAEVQGGIREISMGYECRLEWAPGVTADGQSYDAVQRGLRMNHLAVVEKGRAGSACRIGDGGNRAAGKQERTEMKYTVDGIEYELSDQGVQIVKKLQADAAAAVKRATDAETAAADATKARDAAIGERDALKTQIPTADALDKLVADRSALIGTASKLCPDGKFAGMAADAIRAHVVKAKLGDAAVANRSAEYVSAAFDTLAAAGGGKVDPVADALRGSSAPAANDARSKYLDGLTSAWQGGAK